MTVEEGLRWEDCWGTREGVSSIKEVAQGLGDVEFSVYKDGKFCKVEAQVYELPSPDRGDYKAYSFTDMRKVLMFALRNTNDSETLSQLNKALEYMNMTENRYIEVYERGADGELTLIKKESQASATESVSAPCDEFYKLKIDTAKINNLMGDINKSREEAQGQG